MSKISKKDKRMLEKFRAYLIAERKNRVLPTDGMTEIPLKTGTLQIPKGAICVTTCKLRDADQQVSCILVAILQSTLSFLQIQRD